MMTMLLKFTLWLIGLFNGLWRSLGADTDQLRAILEAKLLYDARRPKNSFGGNQKKEQKEGWTLFFLAAFGLAFAGLLLVFSRTDSALLFYFVVWMVYMIMLLLTDFTEILIDVRDNYIILPQPVNDRTITLARLLHIITFLARLVIAFTLGAQLYFLFVKGWYAWLIFSFILIPLATVLVVFGVNLLYLLLLRVSTPNRFKDLIGYFQIAFTTILLGGYYILPKLLDFEQMQDNDLMQYTLSNFLPPAWLGSLYALLVEGQMDTWTIVRAVLGVVVAIVGVYVVIQLSSDFNRKLLAIGQGRTGSKKKKAKTKTENSKQFGLRQRLAHLLTKGEDERGIFEWVWIMIRRSRDFKIRTYPTLGFIPAFFIYFSIDDGGGSEGVEQMFTGSRYILLLYFCIYAMIVPITQSNFSELYGASWIFRANPLLNRGRLQSGRLLAIITALYIPIYLVVGIFVVLLWGGHTLDDVFTAACNTLFLGAVFSLFEKGYPFSEKMGQKQRGGTFVSLLIIMIGAGALGTAHYFMSISFLSWLVLPLGLMTLVLFYFTLQSIRKAA